jgi:hypothetical protein
MVSGILWGSWNISPLDKKGQLYSRILNLLKLDSGLPGFSLFFSVYLKYLMLQYVFTLYHVITYTRHNIEYGAVFMFNGVERVWSPQ